MDDEAIVRLKGWSPLDNLSEALPDRQMSLAKGKALDLLAAQTFGTEAGKKLLRTMVSRTVLRPTVSASSTQFGAGIREGQNDIIRQLLAMIERGKKEP